MRLVITIMQCKRVVLPHVFLTSALPMFDRRFPGEVQVCLIQHTAGVPRTPHLETSRLSHERLATVADWTSRGLFAPARIIQTEERCEPYPHLPSLRLAVQASIDANADYHLWLEDDAIVFDECCEKWLSEIPAGGVAAYKKKPEGYINAAYYVSTREFDRRLLSVVADASQWDLSDSLFIKDRQPKQVNLCSRRLEAHITRLAQGRIAYLDENFAARYNHSDLSAVAGLIRLLRRHAPGQVPLLPIDFELIRSHRIGKGRLGRCRPS